MRILKNPHRRRGLGASPLVKDANQVLDLLAHCPAYEWTPLLRSDILADIDALYIKDERKRMGLGSFKALGAAFVIARMAHARIGEAIADAEQAKSALRGEVFVAASAGNHGLSLAVGARLFGARAIIYLSRHVPEAFADTLRERGAEVVISGDNYEESMHAAQAAARREGWILLSDSTWEGYDMGGEVMQGYMVIGHEIVAQMGEERPTHVFLQAGVGGLAAAMAGYLRRAWGENFLIIVVEPSVSPALQAAAEAGKIVFAESHEGDNSVASNMGRLDCKEASLIAFTELAKESDYFMTIADSNCAEAIQILTPHKLITSPSGGAGFAALALALQDDKSRETLQLDAQAKALCILSEKQPEI